MNLEILGDGFVDNVSIYNDPRKYGVRVLVSRIYREVVEDDDIKKAVAPWVLFRKALQGSE